MAASISNDAILDAAEAIVSESGAAHLTLDGVAERAQISKGGLMYRYPTKTALLQGMIGRMIDKMDGLREQVRQEFGEIQPSELMVEISMLSKLDEISLTPSAAMLATVANRPDLMEPFRDAISRRIEEDILSEKNPERATILLLAAMGLHFSALLNVPFLGQEQRQTTYANLLRYAAGEKRSFGNDSIGQ